MPQRIRLTVQHLLVSVLLLCGGVSLAAVASAQPQAANQIQPSASAAPNPRAAASASQGALTLQQVSPSSVAAPLAMSGAAITSPPSAGVAPSSPAPASPAVQAAAQPTLDTTQRTVSQLQSQARTTTDEARLAALRTESAKTQAAADTVVSARSKELKTIDRQLARLALIAKRRKLTPAEHVQQVQLTAKQAELESQVKQAETVSTTASHTYDLVAEKRRDSFTSKIFEQTASPVSPDFWSSLSDATSADVGRLIGVAERAGTAVVEAPEPKDLLSFVISLAVAFALVFPARKALEGLVRARTATGGAQGFRLTAHALWVALVDTVLPALAANTLHLGAQWGGLLSETADSLAGAAVIAITWAAAVVALGRATVAGGDAESRLMQVPEDAVSRVRFYLWMVAGITGGGFLLTRLNDVVGASVAATIAANCVMSLAYAGVAGLVLVSFGRNRTPVEEATDAQQAARSSGWTLFSLVLTTAIVLTVGAVLTGYTTLAVLISNQIFWFSMLGAVAYLVLRFTDDLCGVLFQPRGWAARTLVVLFNLRSTTIGQIGVLVSAGLQIAVLLGVLALAITPFGESGTTLTSHFDRLGRAIHIGSAVLSPSAIFAGLATLAVGLVLVHAVRGWVTRRYLPVTGWDAGVRNSVATGVSYLGVGAAVLCALATMGLGFKQIALVASALSVGIGFGLQQVVQNFVSGVILLIERPVKVGDWVNVGGVEGDVRSIRVRATEIQTFDRTTLIVPNSDLITKTVQNKTLGDPRGRIQLQVSIADPAKGRRAAELIGEVARANAAVLEEPEPAVYIDSLAAAGSINFNCYFYVASPRDVYKTRSALYHAVLDAFLAEKIAFMGAGGPTDVVLEPGPKMEGLLGSGMLQSRASDADQPPAPAAG
ncbi:DUF3772 domain-containing protein [Caulobacter sp. S45]|uniref:DUF3772 domain-containing protein n=1 Tax=Caulobacter sp. S45 TaxID=1641861 RepID=UPI00157768BF|nr:DUF3772 domain-containing protein [Caulobacter sp. S45]